jgi:hypothetical protein
MFHGKNMFQCDPTFKLVLQGISNRLQLLQLRLKLPVISCSVLLGDFEYICNAMKSYQETLQHINSRAYEELASIFIVYEKAKQSCKRPENTVPGESPLLQEIENSINHWQTATERLIYSCDSADYPRYVINNCKLLFRNTKSLVQTGDLSAIYQNLSFLCDNLGRLSEFYKELGFADLKKEAENLVGEIDLFERQLKSQKINLERLSGQIDIWFSKLDSLVIVTPVTPLHTVEQPKIIGERTKEAEEIIIPALKIESEARSYMIDLEKLSKMSILLGRYDPGGLDEDIGAISDALKVQEYYTEPGKILYIFTNLQCRWFCPRGDTDCTHRYHVLLSYDSHRNTLRISHFKGYIRERGRLVEYQATLPVRYAYEIKESPRLLSGKIEIKPGQTVYLWISGVRDIRQNKPSPVAISLTSQFDKSQSLRHTIA